MTINHIQRIEIIKTMRMMAPNYTQCEIAAHIGVHVNTISVWANLYQINLLGKGAASILEAKRWKRMWGSTPRRRRPIEREGERGLYNDSNNSQKEG